MNRAAIEGSFLEGQDKGLAGELTRVQGCL